MDVGDHDETKTTHELILRAEFSTQPKQGMFKPYSNLRGLIEANPLDQDESHVS